MYKCFLHSVTFVIIHVGLCISYKNADYTQEIWSKFYYVWAKFIDVLLILCIINPVKAFRLVWLITGIVFVLRLLWEIPAINNYYDAVKFSNIQFLICFSCIIITLITTVKCLKLK